MTTPSRLSQRLAAPLGVVALIAAMPALLPNDFRLYTAITALTYLVIALGLNVVMGYAGVISLGHAAFALIGAYIAAAAEFHLGWPYWWSWIVAMVVCALLGVVTSAPALRLGGFAVAIVTIFYLSVTTTLILHYRSVTGGGDGIAAAQADLSLDQMWWAYAFVVAVLYLAIRNLVLSPVGRGWQIGRLSPVLAESLGVRVSVMKVGAFSLAAALAGLGGAMYPALNGYTNTEPFSLGMGILILLMVVLGGEGTLGGPVLGALVITGIPVILNEAFSAGGNQSEFVYGGLLLAVVLIFPRGLVGAIKQQWHRLSRGRRLATTAQPVALEEVRFAPPDAPAALEIRGAFKSIGGLRILDDVSLAVEPGQVHGLVGPNGSGKTTLLNLIGGFLRAEGGVFRLGGVDLPSTASGRARAGVSRTFQHPILLEYASIFDNVLAGVDAERAVRPLHYLLRTGRARRAAEEARTHATEWLGAVGLGAVDPTTLAANISPGQRRQLEIARACASRPRALLMDEPAVGLSAEEIGSLMTTVRAAAASGVAVVLIDHNVDLVLRLCDVVTVLDAGRVIAHGPPEKIRTDPMVINAYLGGDPEVSVNLGEVVR